MANKNFVVQNGLTVGPLTIDAASGDIVTTGNISAANIEGGNVVGAVESVNSMTGNVVITAANIGAQETLVSGTNIKTINGASLLGAGDVEISSGLGGTVTYVGATVPTGLEISGSPITASGNLVITYESGYAIPTTAKQTDWDTAFSWGDHSIAGYALSSSLANVATTGSYNDLSDKPSIPSGTVESVGVIVPTGLAVAGSPITTSGNITVSYESGYSIPTTTKQSQWDTAYGWGNHASAGYALSSSLATVATSGSYNDLSNLPDLSALADIEQYADLSSFPVTGDTNKVYIARDTGYMYRWNGSGYTQLTDQTAIWGQISGNILLQTDLQSALSSKQETLVSGTNIKTINGESLLGSGGVVISVPVESVNGLTGNVVLDTDDITEGTSNLFFSNTRAVTAIQSDSSWNATDWGTAFSWGNHASAGYALSSSLATVATSGSYNDLTNKPNIPQGTVESVGVSVPTGLSVSGSPVTTSGNIAISYTAGYSIPTTSKQGNWDTAYGWGNHASAGYALATNLATVATSGSYNDLSNKPSIPSGTVQSVGVSVPTGLSVTGSPVTTSGNIAISYTAGYSIPTTTKQTQWDTAYGWGDHASAGYQANLVSGTNIKTLNGTSLLGSGDITISGGATLTNDTTTNTSYYLGMSASSSGSWGTAYVSNSKLYFNPSTGVLHATEFQSLSDARQKDNVETIVDALGVINKLRGVNFNWKENGKASSGVIAQEVEEVLPFLVDTSEDGVKSVNYDAIIGYLIEAVKTLTKGS